MDMRGLKPGITNEMCIEVTQDLIASRFVKGTPEVFATAAMIALIEQTCKDLVQPFLEEGQTTVGVHIDATHIAPTPVGMKVIAKARLEKVEGRRLEFSVEVFDQVEKVSDAKHVRFIVDRDRFETKTKRKFDRIR